MNRLVSEDQSETDVSRRIQRALEAMGLLVVRVHSGKVKVRGGWMRLAAKGTPDIWTELGWIEVKKPGEDRSPEQVAWHAEAKRRGINVAVADSAIAAVNIAAEWRRVRDGN